MRLFPRDHDLIPFRVIVPHDLLRPHNERTRTVDHFNVLSFKFFENVLPDPVRTDDQRSGRDLVRRIHHLRAEGAYFLHHRFVMNDLAEDINPFAANGIRRFHRFFHAGTKPVIAGKDHFPHLFFSPTIRFSSSLVSVIFSSMYSLSFSFRSLPACSDEKEEKSKGFPIRR